MTPLPFLLKRINKPQNCKAVHVLSFLPTVSHVPLHISRSNGWLLIYEQMKRIVHVVLLRKGQKWKMLDSKYQKKIKVGFSYYFRAKIIGLVRVFNSQVFSVLNGSELICGFLARSRNLKKQYMYMEDISLKTPLLIYCNFFQTFFFQNSGCNISVSAAIHVCQC